MPYQMPFQIPSLAITGYGMAYVTKVETVLYLAKTHTQLILCCVTIVALSTVALPACSLQFSATGVLSLDSSQLTTIRTDFLDVVDARSIHVLSNC